MLTNKPLLRHPSSWPGALEFDLAALSLEVHCVSKESRRDEEHEEDIGNKEIKNRLEQVKRRRHRRGGSRAKSTKERQEGVEDIFEDTGDGTAEGFERACDSRHCGRL